MRKKYLLGRVFISHSSADKPFVRRLAESLWKNGYQVWLDEKELVPGDALAQRLSEALASSKVVIVVVTKQSSRSKWLRFELNKAAERMVQGECRIIPVLRGAVEPPPELKGLLYADFRRSYEKGLTAVLSALERESDKAVLGSWAEVPALLGEVFDYETNVSAWGEYDSWSFDVVQIDGLKDPETRRASEDADIVYDVVHDYLGNKKPIEAQWWQEYLYSRDRHPAMFFLVATERPIGFEIPPSAEAAEVRVHIEEPSFVRRIVVIADLSSAADAAAKRSVLQKAREVLVRLGSERGLYGPTV